MGELYTNGVFYSMDAANHVYEAMYVEKGRIAALGSGKELAASVPAGTERIDLAGRAVLPGLIDSHMHLAEYGIMQERVFLGNAVSKEEVLELLKEAIKKRKETGERRDCGREEEASRAGDAWLIGYGFNQDYFKTGPGEIAQLPTRTDLDQVSTEVPILIIRACIHIMVANTKALTLNGLMKPVKEITVEGGEFDCGEDGYPNGIARENALELLYKAMPEFDIPALKKALKNAMGEVAKYGITTVHSDDFTEAERWKDIVMAYRELEAEGAMTVRVCEQCQFPGKKELEEFLAERHDSITGGDTFFELTSLKIIEDGSLGARTAYLREPYRDDPNNPDNRGILIIPEHELYEYMKIAHHADLPMEVHAIGDGTIELILNLYRRLQEEEPKPGLRHGIVHCQITDKELLRRFRDQNILAYIQPIFLHYDLHIVESRVGKELAGTSYAWKSLVDSGVPVCGGSDCPVEFFNVMEGIYCAVTRKDLKGNPKGGHYPEQCLTVEEAVRLFTTGGAYAGGQENEKGSLEVGKLADIAVLSEDIFRCEAERIKEIRVVRTVVGGRTVWQDKKFKAAEGLPPGRYIARNF